VTAQDQARSDLIDYHRALITNRWERALQIEVTYGLDGLPPQMVSIGLQAATQGLDPLEAVEDHLEGSE
jgi:hypothetical protein